MNFSVSIAGMRVGMSLAVLATTFTWPIFWASLTALFAQAPEFT